MTQKAQVKIMLKRLLALVQLLQKAKNTERMNKQQNIQKKGDEE
jgi:hypothetical protein